MKKNVIITLFLTFVLLFTLGACSAGDAGDADPVSGTDGIEQEENDKEDVQIVKVGTMGTYEPFSYEGENGELTGYDLEVLRLIETVDPSLKFEFTGAPWDSLFPGLDADRYQLLANQITSNPDREAKYLLSENTYHVCVSQLIVAEGRDDIQTLEDLVGKKIGTTVGDSYTIVLEDWNEANGNILEIVYYEEDVTTVLQDIVNGRIDATLNDPIMAMAKAEAQGLAIEPVGDRIEEQPTHFILKKDGEGEALLAKVDAALTQLKKDGTLSKLSIEWFGVDYSEGTISE